MENILNIGNVRNIGSKNLSGLNLALLPAAECVCIEFFPHLVVIVMFIMVMVMLMKIMTITMMLMMIVMTAMTN